MPICPKCGKKFSVWFEVNGKKHVSSKRKYCLDCSPYLSGNRVKIEKFETNRFCCACNKPLVGNQTRFCSKKCKNIYNVGLYKNDVVERRRQKKIKLVEFKGGKCERCGYSKCIDALHFHHPDEKNFTISSHMDKSLELLIEEVKKCQLLCANCHAEAESENNKL